MNGQSRHLFASIFAAVTVIILWASAYPAIGLALRGFAPAELAAGRFFVASIVLASIGLVSRIGLPPRSDVPRIVLAGAIGIAIYNLLLNSGQRRVDPGTAGLLINVNPILAALLARSFLNERLNRLGWAGIAVGFAGAATIAIGSSGTSMNVGGGAILILAAAFCFAVQWLLQKPLLSRHRPLSVATWVIVSGEVLLIPWLPAAARACADAPGPAVTAVLYLALGPAALAYALWAFVLSRFSVSRASSLLYMVPPVTLVIDYLVSGRVPAIATLIGGCLTLAGVATVNLWGKPASQDFRSEASAEAWPAAAVRLWTPLSRWTERLSK